MSNYSFDEINNIYDNSSRRTVQVHSVSSPNLQTLCRNISRLFKLIGDAGRDDFWLPTIGSLKRFRFEVSAAPLSNDFLRERARILSQNLNVKVPYCELVYSSEVALMLKLLAEQAQQISETIEANLLEFLTDLIRKDSSKDIAIAIKESRLIPETEESIQQILNEKECEVVCPSNLKEVKSYSSIYLIGAPKWFPEFVFSSPRSRELHIVKHKWISGNWKPETVLADLYKHQDETHKQLEITDSDVDIIEDDPLELIPHINLQHVLDKALEQSVNLMSDDDDVVVARLFLLENDWAVFLEADDNSSVDIIDLDEEIEKKLLQLLLRRRLG